MYSIDHVYRVRMRSGCAQGGRLEDWGLEDWRCGEGTASDCILW